MELQYVCPVLNFLQRQIINKADEDGVVKLAAKFFGKDVFKETIEICRDIFKVNILERGRGSHQSADFMADFYKLLLDRISKDDPVPRFAIMDPSDVLFFPSEPNTIVASRLNYCVRMLNFLVEKQKSASSDIDEQNRLWSFLPKPENATVPVIFSNLPASMQSSNPTKQHEFISNLGCLDKIDHVEQRRDRLMVYMKDNDSASSVASALPPGSHISAQVVKKGYPGII